MVQALVAIDVRSALNVGALMRLGAAFNVTELYLTGITPHPRIPGDQRLPHIIANTEKKLRKTALDADRYLNKISYTQDTLSLLNRLRQTGLTLVALEHDAKAQPIRKLTVNRPCALLVGNEVEGLSPKVKAAADIVAEIKLPGAKRSLNVATAAAIALFALSKT